MRSSTDNTEDKAHAAERRSLRSSLRALYDQKAHSDYLYRERCAEVEALRARLADVLGELKDADDSDRLKYWRAHTDRLAVALQRAREERDAYKKARDENDERFRQEFQGLREDNKALSDVIEKATKALRSYAAENVTFPGGFQEALAILTAGDDEEEGKDVSAHKPCASCKHGWGHHGRYCTGLILGRPPHGRMACLCKAYIDPDRLIIPDELERPSPSDTVTQSPVSATPTVSEPSRCFNCGNLIHDPVNHSCNKIVYPSVPNPLTEWPSENFAPVSVVSSQAVSIPPEDVKYMREALSILPKCSTCSSLLTPGELHDQRTVCSSCGPVPSRTGKRVEEKREGRVSP